MVIKNLQQTYVDKYFFLPLSVNSSCKKCFPASQTKIENFSFSAAGRRPKKTRLQIQIKNDFFQTFCKIFSNIVFYALETLVRHNSILAQMLTSLVWSYSAF